MATLTVFVVDDEPLFAGTTADTTSQILRAAGFQVATLYDGAAVVAPHGISPTPYVVFTDFSMPKLDGLALAAWLWHLRMGAAEPTISSMLIKHLSGSAHSLREPRSSFSFRPESR